MLHIIRHGHSFVEITTDAGSYLIDPYINGNPKCDVSVEDVCAKNILGVFLTHGHADHIGETLVIHEATKAPIVCEYGVGAYFEKEHGITCIVGSLGGKVTSGDATIQFFSAPHGGGVMAHNNPYKCMSAGLLITLEGKTFYHAGDTALTYDMKLLGEFYSVDAACVPIGDVYTMGIEDAARAVGFIKPKIVFPVHYDTWEKLRVDALDWARLVMQDTKTVPKVLKPGQYITVN